MADGSSVDHSMDVRLDRRLSRRIVSSQHCKNFSRRTVKKDELQEFDMEYRKFLDNLLVNSNDEIVEAAFEDFGHDNDDDGTSRCNWSDEKVDPVYKMFFQHLIGDGKAYKVEIPSVNGLKMYIKYEEEEKSSPKDDQNSENPGTTRILRSASKIDEIDIPDKESPVPLIEEEFILDCAKPMSHGVNGNSSTMPSTDLRSAKRLSLSDSDSDILDEDYKTFLTDFLYDDRSSFAAEGDECTSNSEVVMMDIDPCKISHASFGSKYFHPTMDVDSGTCLQSPGLPGICKSSNFRERLLKVLEKPYNQDEYDFYLKEVSACKARVRHRELRSRVLKPYTLDSQGKSYLHLYGELATKIQSVQYDRHRTLNILRGFFYWLQNVSHDDVFKPWMDPSCLDVLPRS